MTGPFSRRELLGIAAAFGTASAGSVASVVGLRGGRSLRRRRSSGPDRLAAWTPSGDAFAPPDASGPYSLRYADLPTLRAVERTVDGRLRAIPHRWLRRISSLLEEDLARTDAYFGLAGRGVVQVHDYDHDADRVGRRLERANYRPATELGDFSVYRQPANANARELRTVPHLDDAVATDGRRLVTCGRPDVEDPVAPLLAAIRARLGGPRLVEDDPANERLLGGVSEADLLTVSPVVREWVEDGPPGLAGLRGYSSAVQFDPPDATVRTLLLYEPGSVPETAAIRSLFLDREAGSRVGLHPVDRLRVDRRGNVVVAAASTPVTAFTE